MRISDWSSDVCSSDLHLYGVICLLLAGAAGAERIVVEGDEDIEIVLPDGRIYVQVKKRNGKLAAGDISGAIERFEEIRAAHCQGRPPGSRSSMGIASWRDRGS